MFSSQRLKGENLTAAQERRIDGEKWILGGGADQNHDPLLYVGQQHVLLSAIEAVQLVDKEDRSHAVLFELNPGFFQNFADFFDAGGDGIDLSKSAMGMLSYHMGQGGLP